MATERVRRLREAALNKDVAWSWQREMLEGEAWRESVDDLWWIRRKGKKDGHILRQLDVVIDADELIVGKATMREPTDEEQQRLNAAREFMATQPKSVGQNGHMAVDYGELLDVGCRGIQRRIREYQGRLDGAEPMQQERYMFYEAAIAALEGVCDLAERYAQQAEQLAEREDSAERKQELREIARICRRVPAGGAESFYEALQSVHFTTFCISYADNIVLLCPGRMDRWLQPFYERDLERGAISRERAQELIDCFYIMMNEIVPPGLAVGVMVGGQDANGDDVTNDVSYMCLQAVEDTRLAYPTLGICWHEDTPEELLGFGCQLMADGRANPAVFNDDVIAEGLRQAGLSDAEKHLYINSTCVEISPIGSSNVWVASPYFNLTQCLLDTMSEFVEGGQSGEFEELKEAVKHRLSGQIDDAVAGQNTLRESRARFGGYPLLSCFVNDCVERGTDIDHGGARYNWIECSFVGLANLVDGLMAIERFVYDEGELELAELKAMLDADYEGAEDWRQRFLKHPAKYGNDHAQADALACEMADFVREECLQHRVRLDDGYYPGFFCWVMHERLGSETGASPDGRKAGVAFADGAGPAQGRERKGPTAAVKSTTRWDHTAMLGGLVLNLKFSPQALANESDRGKLGELIKTYMRLGGQEVQVNCVSGQMLQEAQQRPDEYEDLLVRVAGYTDYFVTLPEGMQDEIISRTEFGGV